MGYYSYKMVIHRHRDCFSQAQNHDHFNHFKGFQLPTMGNVKCNWVPYTYAHDLWVVNAVTTGYYGPLAHFVCHAAFNFLFFLGAGGVVSILGAASVRGGAGRGPQWFSVEAGCNGWYGCIAIIPSSS
jgi:hypothetical protein